MIIVESYKKATMGRSTALSHPYKPSKYGISLGGNML